MSSKGGGEAGNMRAEPALHQLGVKRESLRGRCSSLSSRPEIIASKYEIDCQQKFLPWEKISCTNHSHVSLIMPEL